MANAPYPNVLANGTLADATQVMANFNAASATVSTIAALRLIQGVNNNQIVILNAYATAGDGGGGAFYWNASSTTADNGGTIIAPTGVPTGRWYRLYSGAINVKWFGAKGDGVTNDVGSIQSAINACPAGGTVYFPTPNVNYYCNTLGNNNNDFITLKSNITLKGDKSLIYVAPSASVTELFVSTTSISNVVIDGLRIISTNTFAHWNGWTGNTSNVYAIDITDPVNLEIKNCEGDQLLYLVFCPATNGGQDVRIENLYVTNSANSIYLLQISGFVIDNLISYRPSIANSSTFDHHVYVDICSNGVISNQVYNAGNGYALQLERQCLNVAISNVTINNAQSGITFGGNNTGDPGPQNCTVTGLVLKNISNVGVNFGIGSTIYNIVNDVTVDNFTGIELIASQASVAGWNKITNVNATYEANNNNNGNLITVATQTDLIADSFYIKNLTGTGFPVYCGSGVGNQLISLSNFVVYNDGSHTPQDNFFSIRGSNLARIESCLFYAAGGTTQNLCFNTGNPGTVILKDVIHNWNGVTSASDYTATIPINVNSINSLTGVKSTALIVSGTVYQNTSGFPVTLYINIQYNPTAGAAASAVLSLGQSTPLSSLYTVQKPAGSTVLDGELGVEVLKVPPGWYYSLTVTNATISAATAITG